MSKVYQIDIWCDKFEEKYSIIRLGKGWSVWVGDNCIYKGDTYGECLEIAKLKVGEDWQEV